MKIFEGELKLNGSEKVAILCSRFNSLITDKLIEGAKDSFLRHGGNEEHLNLILVPGAYEIPFALNKILQKNAFDGICCLGAIIRGDTPHFDYVSAESTKGIATSALKHNACVSFGLLTTNNIEQALERAGVKSGNKGFEAMNALIELINLYKKI